MNTKWRSRRWQTLMLGAMVGFVGLVGVASARTPPMNDSSARIPYWVVAVDSLAGAIPVGVFQTPSQAEALRSQLIGMGYPSQVESGWGTWPTVRRLMRDAAIGRRQFRRFYIPGIVEPQPPRPGLGIEGGGFSTDRRNVINGAGFDPRRRGFVEPTRPTPRIDPRGNFGTQPGTGPKNNRGNFGTQPGTGANINRGNFGTQPR